MFVVIDCTGVMLPRVTKFEADQEAEARAAYGNIFEATPETQRARIAFASEPADLKTLGGSLLVMVYSRVSGHAIRKFSDMETAVARTWKALETYSNPGEEPAKEVENDVAKTKTEKTTKLPKEKKPKVVREKKPRKMAGQEPGRVSEFKQVREGSARHTVLKMMDGKHTTAAIAAAIGQEPVRVLQHAYCLRRDCGIGYKFEDDKLLAVYPGSKTLADAVKAPKAD